MTISELYNDQKKDGQPGVNAASVLCQNQYLATKDKISHTVGDLGQALGFSVASQ